MKNHLLFWGVLAIFVKAVHVKGTLRRGTQSNPQGEEKGGSGRQERVFGISGGMDDGC
ncbi:hypothetical protein H8959_001992 [Pygathrix nigripes]